MSLMKLEWGLFLCSFVCAFSFGSCDVAPLQNVETVSTRDSAGVLVVENTVPAWDDTSMWTVSREPIAEIGNVEGSESQTLNRVQDGLRLADGRIVIANGGSNELRFYNSAGNHLNTVGGSGDGPGEFRWLTNVWVWRDSIVAYDQILNRLSFYDQKSRFVRSFRLSTPNRLGRPHARGQFADGSILVLTAPMGTAPRGSGRIEGNEWVFARFASSGEFLNPIANLEESPRWGHSIPTMPPAPYLPFTLSRFPAAIDGNDVLLGTGTEYSLVRLSNRGSTKEKWRWADTLRRVTDELSGRYRSWLLNEPPAGLNRRAIRTYLDEVAFPTHLPAYEQLLTDKLGFAWVQNYTPPWRHAPTWSVFDNTGTWLGSVRTPENVRILEIGRYYVMGVRRDQLGVESVVVYELVRE